MAGAASATTRVETYIACLRYMIFKIRENKRFKTRIQLLDGHLTDLHENTYRFSFDEDGSIFEGSKVDVFVDDTEIAGVIVSVSTAVPRFLLLALDKNMGETIEECELQQDDATFYESLLARYEVESGSGEHPSLPKVEADFEFADRALVNDTKKISHSISIDPSDLNSQQHAFLQKAIGHDISYLWGPPGTGKTKCLGSLIAGFHRASEKSVIVSNTNQAVDQVLLKLSRELIATGRSQDLENGKIIRIGAIHHTELDTEFGHYIDIEVVTKKKSEILQREQQDLMAGVSSGQASLNKLEEILGYIDGLNEIRNEVEHRRQASRETSRKLKSAERQIENTLSRQVYIKEKLFRSSSRGILENIFGASERQLESERSALKSKMAALKLALNTAQKQHEGQKKDLEKFLSLMADAEAATKGKTRASVVSEQQKIESEIKVSQSRLTEVITRLANLKNEIMADALVVGSTLTKVFMAPSQIGKYDNLIVDEASMALLPTVHFAASQAKKRIVISGDFRQLPPILETKNKTIERSVGKNIFLTSGVGLRLFNGEELPNAGMLHWQYRMPDDICKHISSFAYNSRLKSAPGFAATQAPAPTVIDRSLVIIDTSDITPFADIDSNGSRSNTIHAVIAHKLVQYFDSREDPESIGYCAPFRAQARLVKSMLHHGGVGEHVSAGTIHVFQGDEKDTIILDTVEGLGSFSSAGMHIAQEHPAKAQLMTVAISRARKRVIIIANLRVLDKRLPAEAFLRTLLAAAEADGSIIPAEKFVGTKAISKHVRNDLLKRHEELKNIKAEFKLKSDLLEKKRFDLDFMQREASSAITKRSGELARLKKVADQRAVELEEMRLDLSKRKALIDELSLDVGKREAALEHEVYDETEFDEVLECDIDNAQSSLVIYSGFITAKRVEKLSEIFKRAAARGVSMRAIVPPPLPKANGTIHLDQTKRAIEYLEQMGFAVDLRANIHEKAVIIDNTVLMVGSLNPLSFSGNTSESMLRTVCPGICIQFAKKNAARGERSIQTEDDLVKKENPNCTHCGGLTVYDRREKRRPFVCINCKVGVPNGGARKRRESVIAKKSQMKAGPTDSQIRCDWCQSEMIEIKRKDGSGSFWGCKSYKASGCKYTLNCG